MNYRAITLLFLLMTIGIRGWSQSPSDSLQLLLLESKGRERIDLLNRLAEVYFRNDEIEPALSLAHEAWELAKESDYSPGIHQAVKNLAEIYYDLENYTRSAAFYEHCLEFEKATGNLEQAAYCLNVVGLCQRRLSEFDLAIAAHLESAKIGKQIGSKRRMSNALFNVGLVYHTLEDYENAIHYYHQSLILEEEMNDSEGIAMCLDNMGILFGKMKNYTGALKYYQRSQKIYEELKDYGGLARVIHNIGHVYYNQNKFEEALRYTRQSYEIERGLDRRNEMFLSLNTLGDIYTHLHDFDQALAYHKQSLALAQEWDEKRIAYLSLSQTYTQMGDYRRALEYHQLYAAQKDSMYQKEMGETIIEMETKYATEQKEAENKILRQEQQLQAETIRRKNQQAIGLGAGLVLLVCFAGYFWRTSIYRQRVNGQLREQKAIIEAERDRSDKLLLNILPYKIAEDLKQTGTTEPELFDNVTVYFSDIVGFTEKSSQIEPGLLIRELSDIFTRFDEIIEAHSCERIKTIGDAYMAVCGLPEPNPEHALNIVSAAQEIIRFVADRNASHELKWQIRIGIHSGTVVGGVVGIKKYIYDIFGDTINTASRMESYSEPMKINISETTYQLIRDQIPCRERQAAPVKGKGVMSMYFVSDRNPTGLVVTEETLPYLV